MSDDVVPVIREAARVVVLDEADRLLLARFENAQRGAVWWAAPGGALKSGETHEQAAIRELEEETGFVVAELGSQIWTREHVFELGGVWYRQQERFFLVRVEEFDARFNSLDEGEAEYLKALRWWSPDELDAADERLVPGDLAALVRALIESGPPPEPIEVGV
jgi:8-oxo-dGTP pyrophosphatase MutT (NUDIX family)